MLLLGNRPPVRPASPDLAAAARFIQQAFWRISLARWSGGCVVDQQQRNTSAAGSTVTAAEHLVLRIHRLRSTRVRRPVARHPAMHRLVDPVLDAASTPSGLRSSATRSSKSSTRVDVARPTPPSCSQGRSAGCSGGRPARPARQTHSTVSSMPPPARPCWRGCTATRASDIHRR